VPRRPTPERSLGRRTSADVGGYGMGLDFQGDGQSVCVEIHGRAIEGEYSLDCRAKPWQLGLVLPEPEKMAAEAGPQVLAVLFSVRLAGAGDVLHFRQALVSPDRQQAFEGPGGRVLRPAVPVPQEEERQKTARALLRVRPLPAFLRPRGPLVVRELHWQRRCRNG
jgi:hypothetical protein